MRLFLRWIALLIPVVFAPFGLLACLQWFAAPEWLSRSVVFLLVLGVPFWAWCGDIKVKELQRSHQVVCPHCDKPLVGITGELALTTGRCGGCGAVIVEDPA